MLAERQWYQWRWLARSPCRCWPITITSGTWTGCSGSGGQQERTQIWSSSARWVATGTYTDLELICQVSGSRYVHRSGAHLPGEWQQERTQILSSSARWVELFRWKPVNYWLLEIGIYNKWDISAVCLYFSCRVFNYFTGTHQKINKSFKIYFKKFITYPIICIYQCLSACTIVLEFSINRYTKK